MKDLQSVIGKLQFSTTVVRSGKAFLRRLIDLTCHVTKPDYKIRITRSVREDLEVWLTFLKNYNGRTILYEVAIVESNSINLYSDASKKGFGGVDGAFVGARSLAG